MSRIAGTVKIVTVTFLEDDVYDGGIPMACHENAREELFECDEISDAVRAIQREGLTFSATGTDWAADPDGSRISDYATGERQERSAHLVGFRAADALVIQRLVG
jgi:hypothetical protein